MSLVESVIQTARNPTGSYSELVEELERQNELVRSFVNKEISLRELRRGIVNGRSEDFVVIPQIGPLYDLLREVGFDEELVCKITEEERAHFLVAEKYGLEAEVLIGFAKGDSSENELSETTGIQTNHFRIFLFYKIPRDIDEDRMREIIREISFAPDEPSTDDLAKVEPVRLPL